MQVPAIAVTKAGLLLPYVASLMNPIDHEPINPPTSFIVDMLELYCFDRPMALRNSKRLRNTV